MLLISVGSVDVPGGMLALVLVIGVALVEVEVEGTGEI